MSGLQAGSRRCGGGPWWWRKHRGAGEVSEHQLKWPCSSSAGFHPRELRERLKPELLELIRQQRLLHLCEGTLFRKISSRRRQGECQPSAPGWGSREWGAEACPHVPCHWEEVAINLWGVACPAPWTAGVG